MEGGTQAGQPTVDQSDEGGDDGPDSEDTLDTTEPLHSGGSSVPAESSSPGATESASSSDPDPDQP